MKYKTTIFYILVLLFVAITSVYILKKQHAPTSHKEKKGHIASFVLNAHLIEYDEKGQVQTILTAKKITNYQPSGTTIFDHVYIISYTEKTHTPWHIRADIGISNKTGDKIILRGHVYIHKLKTAKNPESTITTTEMTVFPKRSYAETNERVKITRPGTVIHGTGFTANLKTGRYELRSESSAVYHIEQ